MSAGTVSILHQNVLARDIKDYGGVLVPYCMLQKDRAVERKAVCRWSCFI